MAKKMASPKMKTNPVVTSVDDLLAEHLEKAEYHLIEAVKLFERKVKPERHASYVAKLVRAQEMITTLYREELIRIRGPIKVSTRIAKKRR